MSIQIFLFAEIQWSSLIASLEHRLAKYHFYILFVYFYIIFCARMNTFGQCLLKQICEKRWSFFGIRPISDVQAYMYVPDAAFSLHHSRMTPEWSVRRYLVRCESIYQVMLIIMTFYLKIFADLHHGNDGYQSF